MGKNKLKKFAELETLPFVLQYPRERIISEGFPFKGEWKSKLFPLGGPLVLELGCGKGEYTVALAKNNPDSNFVGVDIKGARLWSGAKEVEKSGLGNAFFLRTEIENISQFFEPGEIDEIWITFPDPQMQKVRKRLTSTSFIKRYRQILKPDGIIHLKTDSPFLYEYTNRVIAENNFEVIRNTDDLYGSGMADPVDSIKTYYETQWLARGKKIKMISFKPGPASKGDLQEPQADDIPKDDYRAYPRHNFK